MCVLSAWFVAVLACKSLLLREAVLEGEVWGS